MQGVAVATRAEPADNAPVQMRVPFAASSVSMARQQLRTWMTRQNRSPERIEDARMVLSELIANSIRHAQPLPDGNLLVTWCTKGPELIMSVTDGGAPTMPRILSTAPTALAGRGMAIIEALAKRWWAEQSPSVATVHACLSVA